MTAPPHEDPLDLSGVWVGPGSPPTRPSGPTPNPARTRFARGLAAGVFLLLGVVGVVVRVGVEVDLAAGEGERRGRCARLRGGRWFQQQVEPERAGGAALAIDPQEIAAR